MELGLLISHNALQYREPIPEFRLVSAYEEQGGRGAHAPQPGLPAITRTTLSHGQGMCNWGDETMLWYESWGAGGIRLASCPLQIDAAPVRVYVDVDGLWEHSELTVDVLDEQFRPLLGYVGDACVPLREPGARQPVVWKDRDTISKIDGSFRLRVNFGSVRPEGVRLYALYVE